MPGNSGRVGLILQPRDQRLLHALSVLRVVDREQAAILCGFQSVRRANARLLSLLRAGHLRRSFIGTVSSGRKALYSLPGAIRKSYAFPEHQLLLNRVYLYLRCTRPDECTLSVWRSFSRPVVEGIPLIPDAYALLIRDGLEHPCFVEVDRGTESGSVWKAKAERYRLLALSGELPKEFGQERFRVLVLCEGTRRIEHIRRAVRQVTNKLFWFSTFESINSGSFFGPVWHRPEGVEKVPFS